MTRRTNKRAILDELENLKNNEFHKFCHELRDRRGEPRVKRSDVDDKNRLEITDLLVSTFTESKAPLVAVEILRRINCNDEAKRLESKTKACMDNGDPTFPKTPTGKLDIKPSQEALKAGRADFPVKEPKEVEAEAKDRVLSEGGDPYSDWLVLSRFIIQFGKYKGQTFKWLLENDVGYTAFVVAGHQNNQKDTMFPGPLTANKDSLTRYANAYREVSEEIRCHRGYDRSRQSGKDGEVLLGFGRHRLETLQDLYESEDPDKISYVNFLRSVKSTCEPGTKMEAAVRYILKCDQKQATAATNRPTTSRAPRAALKRRASKAP